MVNPEKTSWRERNRFRIQVAALVLALGGPFGLFWALNAGQGGLAVGFFAVVVLAMSAIIWIS